MKLETVFIFAFNFIFHYCNSQPYPRNYFSKPIDPPYLLAGSFAEIRPDHFHSGIDFSTSEVEGKKIYAAAKGYVSRIKISSVGFGKAIYITHPNGYVTVYGHLKKFTPAIEKYLLKNQYEKESFEIELFPDKKDLRVRKGQVIGYSGNTGSSSGPHLHFEVRDEKTEEPINPQLFGYAVADNFKPEINWLRIVPQKNSGLLYSADTARNFKTTKVAEGIYTIESTAPVYVSGKIGFEFSVDDRQKQNGTFLGIYSLQLKVDSTTVYSYKYDRFNFSDTRYVNSHIDYAEKIKANLIFERCFLLPGNNLKFYDVSSGIFNFTENRPYQITAIAQDFNGNTSELKFMVLGNTSLINTAQKVLTEGYVPVFHERGITVQKENFEINIPPFALYETCLFSYSLGVRKTYAPQITIGDREVPLHLPMSLSIRLELPDSLKSKAVIVSLNGNGNMSSIGGKWNGNFLFAKTRRFGTFTVAIDTVPPLIEIKMLPPDKFSKGRIRVRILDSLSGIKSYRGTIDGKWVLLEYDARNDMLTGHLKKTSKKRLHHLEIEVVDERDNVSRLSSDFSW
jgi:hypothetical protein